MNTAIICRKLIFTQVLLGIVASCMAERNPGLLLIAGAIGAMSWYVTEGPSGRVLPRWAVNVGAMLAAVWLAGEIAGRQVSIVLAMGHFIIVLQLLMLYMKKTDREYAQLLVLSLLQMIGASVLSVSMIYGVFLIIYCVVALVTVVVFHLTATADRVQAANQKAAGMVSRPARFEAYVAPNMRRQLAMSTVIFGLVCGAVGAGVFVVIPRTGKAGPSFTGPSRISPRQTGFSTTVQLGTGPIGTGSREPILNLSITSHGQPVGHPEESWLIRGLALDEYSPRNHTWTRSNFATAQDRSVSVSALNRAAADSIKRKTALYEAEIALRDTRHRAIFTVISVPFRRGSPGFELAGFESDNIFDVSYSALDQQLEATGSIISGASYRLSWPVTPARLNDSGNDLTPLDELMRQAEKLSYNPTRQEPPPYEAIDSHGSSEAKATAKALAYARTWKPEKERLRDFALSIIGEAGLERDPDALHTPDDLRIASVLSQYLQSRYTYDLVNPLAAKGQDPVVHFLFDRRRGHCEVFAAGLTALCRSIGIPARLATGFRASEFNSIGGYYVVRQSNAHAWTEVDGGPGVGWMSFDATPSASVDAVHRAPDGLISLLRSMYEHAEFAWIRQVVAFDSRTRKKVIDNSRLTITLANNQLKAIWARARDWGLGFGQRVHLSGLEIMGISLSFAGLTVATIIVLRSYMSRRRRLARLQISRLPSEARRDLGRRLGFYLTMLDILERHGHRRPLWQSPQEFADQLAREFPLRFDPVVALTEMFYDVRFGRRKADAEDRKRIRAHLKRLDYTAVQRRI